MKQQQLTKRTQLARLIAVLTAVAAMVGLNAAPAQADSSGHNWVETSVTVGATYRTQYLYHTGHGTGSCYSTQGIYVDWNMSVQSSGIQVNWVEIEFYNNSYTNSYTIGRKWITGSTTPWSYYGYNEVPTRDVVYPWVKRYYVGKFVPWSSYNKVNFNFGLSVPCGGTETLAFVLKKA